MKKIFFIFLSLTAISAFPERDYAKRQQTREAAAQAAADSAWLNPYRTGYAFEATSSIMPWFLMKTGACQYLRAPVLYVTAAAYISPPVAMSLLALSAISDAEYLYSWSVGRDAQWGSLNWLNPEAWVMHSLRSTASYIFPNFHPCERFESAQKESCYAGTSDARAWITPAMTALNLAGKVVVLGQHAGQYAQAQAQALRVAKTTDLGVLGLTEVATEREIKAAYHKLSLERHPDKGGTEDAFKELNAAYDRLKNPKAYEEAPARPASDFWKPVYAWANGLKKAMTTALGTANAAATTAVAVTNLAAGSLVTPAVQALSGVGQLYRIWGAGSYLAPVAPSIPGAAPVQRLSPWLTTPWLEGQLDRGLHCIGHLCLWARESPGAVTGLTTLGVGVSYLGTPLVAVPLMLCGAGQVCQVAFFLWNPTGADLGPGRAADLAEDMTKGLAVTQEELAAARVDAQKARELAEKIRKELGPTLGPVSPGFEQLLVLLDNVAAGTEKAELMVVALAKNHRDLEELRAREASGLRTIVYSLSGCLGGLGGFCLLGGPPAIIVAAASTAVAYYATAPSSSPVSVSESSALAIEGKGGVLLLGAPVETRPFVVEYDWSQGWKWVGNQFGGSSRSATQGTVQVKLFKDQDPFTCKFHNNGWANGAMASWQDWPIKKADVKKLRALFWEGLETADPAIHERVSAAFDEFITFQLTQKNRQLYTLETWREDSDNKELYDAVTYHVNYEGDRAKFSEIGGILVDLPPPTHQVFTVFYDKSSGVRGTLASFGGGQVLSKTQGTIIVSIKGVEEVEEVEWIEGVQGIAFNKDRRGTTDNWPIQNADLTVLKNLLTKGLDAAGEKAEQASEAFDKIIKFQLTRKVIMTAYTIDHLKADPANQDFFDAITKHPQYAGIYKE